jgi:predicted AAA+ superfamily ATPase
VEARRAAIAEYEKLAMEEARIAREAFTKEINTTTEELERRAKQFVEAEKILKESSEAKKYLRDVLKDDEEKLSKLPKWLS